MSPWSHRSHVQFKEAFSYVLFFSNPKDFAWKINYLLRSVVTQVFYHRISAACKFTSKPKSASTFPNIVPISSWGLQKPNAHGAIGYGRLMGILLATQNQFYFIFSIKKISSDSNWKLDMPNSNQLFTSNITRTPFKAPMCLDKQTGPLWDLCKSTMSHKQL